MGWPFPRSCPRPTTACWRSRSDSRPASARSRSLAIWVLPGDAISRRDQLTVTALLVGLYLPWTIVTPHLALLSQGPVARVLNLGFDLFAIASFALVIPSTRPAVMFAYVLVIAFHAYVSGRTAGLAMCAASLVLVFVAETRRAGTRSGRRLHAHDVRRRDGGPRRDGRRARRPSAGARRVTSVACTAPSRHSTTTPRCRRRRTRSPRRPATPWVRCRWPCSSLPTTASPDCASPAKAASRRTRPTCCGSPSRTRRRLRPASPCRPDVPCRCPTSTPTSGSPPSSPPSSATARRRWSRSRSGRRPTPSACSTPTSARSRRSTTTTCTCSPPTLARRRRSSPGRWPSTASGRLPPVWPRPTS